MNMVIKRSLYFRPYTAVRVLLRITSVPVTQQVQNLVDCATGEPDTVRVHIRLRAEALATEAGCERSYPLQEWDRAHPQEASACGMLQSAIVASINMLEENRHAKHIYVCRDW